MSEVNQATQQQDVYVFPTSYAQQRLWFLDQFEPNSPFYNIPSAVRFQGKLDLSALEQSINAIVRRHETLRTTFAKMNGKPVQVVHPFKPIAIPKLDLRHLPIEQREAEAIRLAQLEARKPFDLARGPLVRVKLIQLDDQDYVVLFTMHHIISDGWSVGVLIREISILYNAAVNGQPDPLPELPIQYADFAIWQQQYLTGEVLERQLSYWKHQLNGRYGKLQVLELPTDRPRPAVQTSNGDNVDAYLPGPLIQQLKSLSSQQGATLFMTLLAAFKVLLYRYTGQEDISVGSPIANRTRAEIEGLIGFFVNTLVLRTDLSGDPTFRELVQRVREVTLGAYANQDIPFERLVELIQPERDMSHSPLFQVMFILQNNPMNGGIELPDVHLSTLNINAGTSTFDLTLMVTEQAYGASISIEYNTDLFDESTMRRLLGHYQQLLEGIVANPDERISRLPILASSERQQVLVDWNRYEADYPQGLCIHQLFEAQVERTPEAIAVAFDGQYLTYQELDSRANQLAHYLRKHGVGPEKLVGICADKSLDLIVGVIGTMKAGGAYVPIDPTYPPDRIAHMLTHSNVTVLLTQHRLVSNLPDHEAEIICLDTDWVKIARQSADRPMINVTPENLVYVIYTSGSTGKSKGVMVMHKSLVNQYHAWEETFRLRSGVFSHLQMASFSFDVFSGDLVRALCSGGKLVLVPRDLLLEADKLYQLMRKEQVDIAEFVPAVLRNLVQYLDNTSQDLQFMKVLIAGSDVWYVGEYKKFLTYCGPNTRLLNTFGLTEATIDSSYFESKDLNLALERLVPIGIPFNNTKVYIVDQHLQPLPIGIPGELCVGGYGVARGYLNRPELTAEKFMPNPFSGIPGDRLYRTGDRARFLSDGNIEFLGRIDNQVKIRGYRIELGEIESALGKHESVKDVVVLARDDSAGSKRLVAYIVPNNGVKPAASELHRFLKEQLPDYMVPSYFVFLDAMPLTPNSKIDRKALPAPDASAAVASESEFLAPRTPTEQTLARIWSHVLGIETIGVNDNFFELGGHSLLATQVISRIRDEFNVDLPLRSIFEEPFIAALASKIDGARASIQAIEAPPIVPIPRDQELPLSFAQQRLWFLDQLEPNSPFYNIAEAVRLKGDLDIAALEQSLSEVVRRHESLRTTFHSHRGKPYQVIHPNMTIPMRCIDLRAIPRDDRELELPTIAQQEAQRPFDLAAGPLLRATLVQLDADDHVVFYTMHHIIGDDWSTAVLVREITLCYEAFTHQRPSPLPELPIQYADFAHWQQQWLQGEVLEAQLNYWKQQLSGAPARLELPTDRPRPAVQTYNGDYVTFELSEELSQAIKGLGSKENTTLFMTLLAGFQTLLYRYSGQHDILVGSPIANRTNAQLENLIGFFVNTLVFRTDLSGRPSFKQVLQRVREVALGAFAHQDLPFEKLVDALQPQRDLSHSPLFQVMFVFQNVPRQATTVSGLTISPIENHSGTSKFDLTLFMLEEGNKLAGALEYNTDLFDKATIVRMLRHFEHLLKQLVANPEKPIDAVTLLTPEERHRAIYQWNNTQVAYPRIQFVHHLFEAQVMKTPQAPAVVFESEQMTYLELNQTANQLAHYLQKLGVGPEVVVGIFMERSLELMVALLGVLKAGGAYLPIDPSYPKERIAYMLEDANAVVLLTQKRLLVNLPEQWTQPSVHPTNGHAITICLDSDWRNIASESDQNPFVKLDDQQLAYVIYTSGSTGKPKGTLISHRGLMNYLFWCIETYPLKQGRGSLVHSSLAFDATITGLYAPLLVGRAVYLAPETKDIEMVTRMLRQYRNFSIVKITPAHLQLLGNQLSGEEAADLVHAFIIGGENLTSDHIAFWLRHAPKTQLINEYGPTETVVGCMNYDTPHDFQKSGSVPIGFPIANMQIYLLDENLEPVPIGVTGEMYIGGVGVARGYLHRPDLTAEKFIPDPFSRQLGARLYRTGDLARYLPDGNIEFLGRIDHQVKIRGFRIELGEIEAALGKHPGVKENVVIDWKTDGDTRLAAYYVPRTDPAPSMDELRDFLKEQLPEYMIPATFMKLDSIPLTSNAKVDRKALPVPEVSRADLKKEFVAPRTHTEQELAKLWSELIKIDRVGIYDNFFELGGHSLLATQLIARVREQFKIELPLIAIFESPTLAELAGRIEQAIIKQGVSDSAPIRPIPRDGSVELVLSFSQQRLWFLDQLDPGQSFYNIPSSVRLIGRLNIAALRNSISEVMRRHEILRTSFTEVKGRPVMLIDPIPRVHLPIVDLSELPSDHQEAESQRLANEIARLPFDLAHGPLVRTVLVTLGPEHHVVLFTMHHIISDGWSVNILMREMAILYQAFAQNQPSPLPDLPIQFADYAHWQRTWLTGEVFENQLLYWKKKLANAPALLELPTDRPRPSVKTFHGSLRSFEIPRDLTERIEQLGRQHGTTLFMTLLAAFKTLLYRYSGQSDISLGTPIANRTRKELEDLIGFFANTLVLRTDLSGDPSFVELMRRVKGVCIDAYQNQDVPFEKLVELIQPERNLSHTPLFQVMFILQNNPRTPVQASGLEMIPIMSEIGTTQFDLTLSLEPGPDGIAGVLEYNTDLFNGETIEQMVEHFINILHQAVADPEQRISQLPLLSQQEYRKYIYDWNNTAAPYPDQCCIHELFEAQVERTPGAIAVVFEEQKLTYRQLNQRANQLAHYLRRLGVGPEVVVGISVERSIEMVVGLLGIMKAGGAYLPIDPAYPSERIIYMLADANLTVLLTQQKLLPRLPLNGTRAICLDRDWDTIAAEPKTNLRHSATIDNLAYMIYTSGSTGKPKGVMLRHRGLCNLTHSQIQDFAVTRDSRVLQFASFSFDASVSEIFMALLTGATLYLASRETLLSTPDLIALFQREKITTVTLPPSLLKVLPTEGLEHLSTIISAGEACTKDIALRWSRGRRLLNAYGPTETTIGVTSYLVEKIPDECTTIPIGRPIQNTQLYILDPQLNPVPRGVRGELFIGGIGVGRGYHNRPDLTAEKFIPDPFSQVPGARLYRTGDLARYLPDGTIEFIGRIDHQVKVRGFRIELGEIESALLEHPEIQHAVVLAKPVRRGSADHRLIAYLVLQPLSAVSNSDLTEFLKTKLPEYSIPSTFVRLDAMPLTPNGKVDRNALPEPDFAAGELSTAYVAPQTDTEKQLVVLWQEFLGVEKIGTQHSFFELGGHSLIATQLISRIREQFQVAVPIRSVFESPTIAALAKVIDQLRPIASAPAEPKIAPVPRDQELPLSYAQRRLWFLDQLEPGTPFYNLPAAFRITGPLNYSALAASFNEIIRRHEILRTRFIKKDGRPIQVIAPELKFELPIIDLSHLAVAEQQQQSLKLASEEAQRPFDLTQLPLLRATLLKLADQDHIILLNMHHIISDGWSMNIFIKEMTILYEAFLRGLPSPLPELSIQYADFAYWQQHWLTGETLQAQLDYWKQQLADSPTLLELPIDRPRPAIQTFDGNTLAFELPEELSRQIRAFSQRHETTLFTTLLAAFQALLHRYSGQDDINVGTPIANRNRAEIEGLIGFFVNTLVMRARFDENPSFQELVAQMKRVALEAYANQDVPFEMVVDALQPERDMSFSPLFQVVFTLQNAKPAPQQLSDLVLTPMEAESGIAKFDLTLSMIDAGEKLVGSVEYNTNLFDSSTIQRMIRHFRVLLTAALAEPDRPVAELPVLTESEKETMLMEWNQTHADFPSHLCAHQWFEKVANEFPNAIAVCFNETKLSYGELNRKSNQLAHYLRQIGIGPEMLVAICLERSIEMIIAQLAVLKAGGAFVPLDPSYPPERLAFMLAETETPVLLTQRKVADRLNFTGVEPVMIEEILVQLDESRADNPTNIVSADNLAYMIYTSGSTGKPKGTMLRHRGLCNFIHFHIHKMGVCPGNRVLQFASFSFDASLAEIYTALLSGSTLYLVERETLLSIPALHRLLHAEQITFAILPPAILKVLSPAGLEALQVLISAGEACPLEVARIWSEGRKFYNGYGPTEASIGPGYYRVTTVPENVTYLPVGKPIDNIQMYILDRNLQPVPIGVVGEIYISGVGLARGYYRRPDLTAEKFLPNPFSEDPGARMYRTGDLGRFLPDGNIEFLGRADHQVKIRSFRIETGEVEQVLNEYPGIQQAIVIAREISEGDKRLVGYFVPKERTTEIDLSQLRAFLSSKLPEFMIPSALVKLDSIPTTPNGKVDRKALPAPDESGMVRVKEIVPPADQLEIDLVKIWESVLKVSPIGVTDNFFELGGHSLLAIHLLARIQQQFDIEIPLVSLFKQPTIRHLAEIIRSHREPERKLIDLEATLDSDAAESLVVFQDNHSRPPFFVVHPSGGSVHWYADLARQLPDQPFYGIQARGVNGEAEPHTQIEEMAAYYIRAIKTRQPQGPYFIASWSMGMIIAFEMAQQLQAQGETVALLAIFDQGPFLPKAAPSDNAEFLQGMFNGRITFPMDELKQLDETEQFNYVLKRLKKERMISRFVRLHQFRSYVEMLKKQMYAWNNYQVKKYPGKVTLFKAMERHDVEDEEPDLGWGRVALGGVEVHEVPGNHNTMLHEPHVGVLAEKLKKCLDAALDAVASFRPGRTAAE